MAKTITIGVPVTITVEDEEMFPGDIYIEVDLGDFHDAAGEAVEDGSVTEEIADAIAAVLEKRTKRRKQGWAIGWVLKDPEDHEFWEYEEDDDE